MGKVHGSLARAGKVKSQTPKVSFNSTRLLQPLHTTPKSKGELQEKTIFDIELEEGTWTQMMRWEIRYQFGQYRGYKKACGLTQILEE
ncbi:hypothetical protein FQN49_000511 [Arthroderma sp. PD_2]|nr:hypothetical protein FQN49_000511 [Arthroderma sp. PD_2]